MQVSDHDWQAPGGPAPRSNDSDAAEAPAGASPPPAPPQFEEPRYGQPPLSG
jgi:hypothetical protein